MGKVGKPSKSVKTATKIRTVRRGAMTTFKIAMAVFLALVCGAAFILLGLLFLYTDLLPKGICHAVCCLCAVCLLADILLAVKYIRAVLDELN